MFLQQAGVPSADRDAVLASVYTEMNATSKGVKLGIFEEGRGKGMEPAQASGQPYVDFMGRRCVWLDRPKHAC